MHSAYWILSCCAGYLQATLLLLFNDSDTLSYGDIQAAMRLEDSELKRTLASLSLAKERWVWVCLKKCTPSCVCVCQNSRWSWWLISAIGSAASLKNMRLGLCRVLLKDPPGSDIKASDVFRYNAGYVSRLYRVKINNLQMQ